MFTIVFERINTYKTSQHARMDERGMPTFSRGTRTWRRYSLSKSTKEDQDTKKKEKENELGDGKEEEDPGDL